MKFITNRIRRSERLEPYLKAFKRLFRTPMDCLNELLRQRLECLKTCPYCRAHDFARGKVAKVFYCSVCNLEIRILAATAFEKIRRYELWLFAWWLYEHGIMFSSSEFHRVTGCAQSTALHIIKTYAHIIKDNLQPLPEAPSAHFESVICRRSLETPDNKHPFSEQQKIENLESEKAAAQISGNEETSSDFRISSDKKPQSIECQNTEAQSQELRQEAISQAEFELDQDTKKILSQLSETIEYRLEDLSRMTGMQTSRILSALSFLEIYGLIEVHFGLRYVLKGSTLKATKKHAENYSKCVLNWFLSTIKSISHGVSRKCLQYYLALFHWTIAKKRTWRKSSLLRLCFNSAPIPSRKILDYVSPALLKIPKKPRSFKSISLAA